VKTIVEKIMFSETKLDVMANSWPLFYAISMFLSSYFTDAEGKGRTTFFNVVSTFFDIVAAHLKKFKEECESQANMLKFYQLRNLISTFTSIVRFLLCF
jgi:hypothetical protein